MDHYLAAADLYLKRVERRVDRVGSVYELKLTGSGKPTGAGHFHADGTFHQGTEH